MEDPYINVMKGPLLCLGGSELPPSHGKKLKLEINLRLRGPNFTSVVAVNIVSACSKGLTAPALGISCEWTRSQDVTLAGAVRLWKRPQSASDRFGITYDAVSFGWYNSTAV